MGIVYVFSGANWLDWDISCWYRYQWGIIDAKLEIGFSNFVKQKDLQE